MALATKWSQCPLSIDAVSLGCEPNGVGRSRKRRNSHQGTVFGEARNRAVMGISELVEAGGVEPPSENASTRTSPGADGYLHSRALT